MKQTIYIDVLVSVNIFINYFLLLSVAKFSNLKSIRKKMILAAFVGSLYSLIILLPPINSFFSLLIKLVMSVSVVIFAFEFVSLKTFLKALATFYGINFIFGGIIFCVWYFAAPKGIFINNHVIYFHISPIFLIFTTLGAYLAIRIMNRFISTKEISSKGFAVQIMANGQVLNLCAKLDTGNSLKEPFSNLPVVVINYNFSKKILPLSIKKYLSTPQPYTLLSSVPQISELKNFRIIPFKTVSGNGLLPAFKADYISIKGIKKEAYIAVCKEKIFNDEFQALIGLELAD